MVSGNPPRHSKATDEPVTIDLEAEAAAHAADSEKMTERDSSTPGGLSVEEAEALLKSETEASPEQERARADEGAFTSPTAAERAAAYSEPTENAASPKQREAAIASLVAAGIVGGLIALIGVGAIQYAGLLPGGGSAAKSNSAEINALNAEIDGLKQTVANLAAAPTAKPDTGLTDRVAALETVVKNAPAAPAADGSGTTDASALNAANQKIADLGSQLDQLKSSMAQATQDQASTGADITKRLDDAEKKLNEPGEGAAVARAIAAAGLKAAIDRGGPFRPELDTFASVAPDDPAIADLRNFAETGIPSRADLIRQVPDVATAIVATSEQAEPDESWSNRLMSSAKSLVTVRPVGDVQGDGVDAIAARFENKVKNGDLPGAVNEWNTLPDAAKSASAAFKQSLDARIRVEDLVGEALSKAIAGAGKQS
ncbi:hypothetical protein DTW90_13080 [Neorhizobium sp. P12A]|uniref:COG4223 family protein n=1 Tax=Neorhizobium sp. P12A TaxID=2268027 RepID=UPI0011EFD298|nr:mitofilin family membrane protein [Neorhizobium sp. P12A]KAA0698976.1 hypothetical protein DTW90_13080 [Neorhizobium sp. P12A]